MEDHDANNYSVINYNVSDFVATITLNRPRRLNALSTQLSFEIHQALNTAELDDQVRVIVITGLGKAFCAGADLAELQKPAAGVIEDQLNNVFGPVFAMIYKMAKPVICAVNGPVAGGGSAFPLVCDLTVMAEEAYLYPAFSAIGLVPDCGISWLLQRQVGSKLAYQIYIENKNLTAARCLEFGLINRVVPASQLEQEVRSWAEQIAGEATLVPVKLKQLLREVPPMDFVEAIAYEGRIQDSLAQTDESRERIAKFLQSSG